MRRSQRWLTVVRNFVLLLLLAGCVSAPLRVVDASANGQRVVLKVGQELDIQLDEKAITLYNWDALRSASKVLTPLGQGQFEQPLDPIRLAGSGTSTRRYRAIATGSDTLEFVFRRQAELLRPDMPRLVFQIVVE